MEDRRKEFKELLAKRNASGPDTVPEYVADRREFAPKRFAPWYW